MFKARCLAGGCRAENRIKAALRAVPSVMVLAFLLTGGSASAHETPWRGKAEQGCRLRSARGDIRHVIYVQFDNTHFMRDNPNVPSDLEQMPHLLNFIQGNGTLLSNDHTVLTSHTATGILSSLTGLYGDRMGQPIGNSFRYFNPDGSSSLGVSFAYWTDSLYAPSTATPTDTTPQMIDGRGRIAPAPWVPYTRAGCDVGMVAAANTVLENIKSDIPTVFGVDSSQAREVAADPGRAYADFVGVAVHCARGSGLCTAANGARPDLLPDEPGGYQGYSALFGHKYVAPQISPSGPLTDLSGKVIADSAKPAHIGFPGFGGMSAAVSLAYVAAMQEHGIPVTYAYIADAHDNHHGGHKAYGPGEAGYVAQLKAYDKAFATFFRRLAAHGITRENTLFVFTVDEGDHFVGSAPTPAGCDGVNTPCSYDRIGEVNANLAGLLATRQGNTTPFKVHSDSAPSFYVAGHPDRDDPLTRKLEQDTARLTALNPYSGNTDPLVLALADPVELKLLHMVTADPMRTPSFIMFANPDYYLYAGRASCAAPCVTVNPAYAWNHGDITPEIARTWLGLVGPGVKRQGVDDRVWSDHTDVRPTMLTLLGLRDSYVHDGRALMEILRPHALPRSMRIHYRTLLRLAEVYKQINAPFGRLARASLVLSTRALASDSRGDAVYSRLEERIKSWTARRDVLAAAMKTSLDRATFRGQAVGEEQARGLIRAGRALLAEVHAAAGYSLSPARPEWSSPPRAHDAVPGAARIPDTKTPRFKGAKNRGERPFSF